MSVMSGKIGEILVGSCTVKEFHNCNLEYGPNLHPYQSRSGGGAQKVVAGAITGNGSFDLWFDPADPAMLTSALAQGAVVAMIIRESSTSKKIAAGNGMLGKYSIPISREGEPVLVTIPFEIDGTWSFAQA